MPAANIESAGASTGHRESSSVLSPLASSSVPFGSMPNQQANRRRKTCCNVCSAFMWRLLNCFRSTGQQEQQQIRARPLVISPVVNQYQAPVVTPSPRASGSVSSCDEELAEQGTLLPKRRTPEPARAGEAASSAAAAAAAAAAAVVATAATEAGDAAAREPPRHRRTGSEGSRAHVEGVRARVMTSAAAAAAAKAKFGTNEAEFSTVAELLGADVEDDDFCPTCLEAYTDDNPKIFTRCGHAFHMQCIYAWLERKSTCPLCERPMDLQDDILL